MCQCTDNTMGERCELCLPLFNDRPWVPGGGAGDNSSQCRGNEIGNAHPQDA